jgi:hypothetical protein
MLVGSQLLGINSGPIARRVCPKNSSNRPAIASKPGKDSSVRDPKIGRAALPSRLQSSLERKFTEVSGVTQWCSRR